MGKILITALISILPFNNISHPHEEDPFTTYIQEKLIELGYLDVVTVGDFNGTVDFGNGNVTSNSLSADMFILKLNFSGNIE